MSARIVGALLARNEAAEDRYLVRVLTDAQRWADDIVVLDDRSTDGTSEICENLGCRVFTRDSDTPMWGAETPARAQLWDLAAQQCGPDDWILVFDADMILSGNPCPLAQSWDVDAWAWTLYDLWDSETTARVDGPWGFGPVQPRPWMFRPSVCPRPEWRAGALHVGHAPANFRGLMGVAPDLHWLHLSYLKPAHRRAKHAQYMAQAHTLTPFERAHAESIND